MTRIHLNVPFKHKDRAKALGARWDHSIKKWYIAENMPLEPFSTWLPSDLGSSIFEPLTDFEMTNPQQDIQPEITQGISLSQLLSRVSQAVSKAIPSTEWIRAEISDCHSKPAYFYLDLVELDGNRQLLCKAKGIIFQNRIPILTAKFKAATGGFLKPGMKVLLQVKVNFNIMYGLGLSVEDIDPNYTLGDMAAKLAQIRKQLKTEGLYNKNKQLPLPKDFTRIAVISPDLAAGLGDFKREAIKLEDLDLCNFHYYTAQFQGTEAREQILVAIKAAIKDHEKLSFDALVILRGGGAVIDLAWLNDYTIAKQLCDCPFVVFTGIGHERDNTILDEIACQRFDTPSKVIAYIFNRITENAGLAVWHANEIITESNRLLSTMQHAIFEQFTMVTRKAERDFHHIQQLAKEWYYGSLQQAKNSLILSETNLTHLLHRVQENGESLINALIVTLRQYWNYLQESCPAQIVQAEHLMMECWLQTRDFSLELKNNTQQCLKTLIDGVYQDSIKIHLLTIKELGGLMENIMGLEPTNTLKRGYTLVRNPLNNKIIASKSELAPLLSLQIQFHDGNINVKPS